MGACKWRCGYLGQHMGRMRKRMTYLFISRLLACDCWPGFGYRHLRTDLLVAFGRYAETLQEDSRLVLGESILRNGNDRVHVLEHPVQLVDSCPVGLFVKKQRLTTYGTYYTSTMLADTGNYKTEWTWAGLVTLSFLLSYIKLITACSRQVPHILC